MHTATCRHIAPFEVYDHPSKQPQEGTWLVKQEKNSFRKMQVKMRGDLPSLGCMKRNDSKEKTILRICLERLKKMSDEAFRSRAKNSIRRLGMSGNLPLGYMKVSLVCAVWQGRCSFLIMMSAESRASPGWEPNRQGCDGGKIHRASVLSPGDPHII